MARSTAAQDSDESAHRTMRWLEIALIFVVFFVVGGDPPPHVNESHYLVKAKHYWNPDWCAGDLFLESADPHLLFYETIGALTQWFRLPVVAWLGRCAVWLCLAASWQYLSNTILPRRYLSCVTALCFAVIQSRFHFAGEWVIGGVESKCIAYAFVFWGLAEVARGRWLRVWPLMGMASAFHVLVGGWSCLAAFAVWATERGASRPRLLTLGPSIALGAVLALVGVIPSLQLATDVSPETRTQANLIYVFQRLPHHLAPLTLPAPELTTRSLSFLAALAAFGFIWRKCSDNAPDELARIQRFAWVAVLIATTGLVIEIAAWNHPALAASLLKYYWFRLADVAVPLALALSLGWYCFAESRPVTTAQTWCVALVVLLPALLVLQNAAASYLDNTPPADVRITAPGDWRDACMWARRHTPPGSLFLIPRSGQSFKWYADRADYCNYKDVPQDAQSLVEWYARCQEVFYYQDPWGETTAYGALGEIGTDKIRALCMREDIDYVLAEEYPPLQLPVVYANDSYKIYDVRAENSSDTQHR